VTAASLSHYGRGSLGAWETANAGALCLPRSCAPFEAMRMDSCSSCFYADHFQCIHIRYLLGSCWNPPNSQGHAGLLFQFWQIAICRKWHTAHEIKGLNSDVAVQIRMRYAWIIHCLRDVPWIRFSYLPPPAHSKAHSEAHSKGQKKLHGVALLFLFHHFLLLPHLYTHFLISFELVPSRTYSTLLQPNDNTSEHVNILY